MRRALSWFRARLVAMAEAGTLRVRWEGRWVDAVDSDDVDEWLVGRIPPSYASFRDAAPEEYAAAGVEVVIPA